MIKKPTKKTSSTEKVEKPTKATKVTTKVAKTAKVKPEVTTATTKAVKATKVRKLSKAATKTNTKTKKTIAPAVVPFADPVDNHEAKAETTPETTPAVKTKAVKTRSRKYRIVRAKIDRTKLLTPTAAVTLIKKLSYAKFGGSLEAHIEVKELGTSATVTLPHSTGKTIRVAIASDELLAQIEAGQIEFDVLVSTPQFMGKLAKLARVLGPKGLMPNPKNGTLTDNPERKAKELAGGALTIKTEKKAPLIHLALGKLSLETVALTENLETLLKALRGKVKKIAICATMSPSLKILVEED